ncbi:hypothetical protein [Leptolyngbya sp. 7M]|nr:hypothetical protein [Leptolyngbya sp. 7M]
MLSLNVGPLVLPLTDAFQIWRFYRNPSPPAQTITGKTGLPFTIV